MRRLGFSVRKMGCTSKVRAVLVFFFCGEGGSLQTSLQVLHFEQTNLHWTCLCGQLMLERGDTTLSSQHFENEKNQEDVRGVSTTLDKFFDELTGADEVYPDNPRRLTRPDRQLGTIFRSKVHVEVQIGRNPHVPPRLLL